MTTPSVSHVTLTRPSALKEASQTLLGGLFQPLGSLVSAGTLGPLASVGESIVGLVAKARPEESTAEAAWRLVWPALRDAVDDLADAARSRRAKGWSRKRGAWPSAGRPPGRS